jgi:flagellar basal-body rod modification protein FlgD
MISMFLYQTADIIVWHENCNDQFGKLYIAKRHDNMSITSILNQPTLISSGSGGPDLSASEEAAAKAEKEKVDFLNLLLTQLENQNPLDPLDTKDFTAQLTRYSILEQGIETNEQLSITNDTLKTSATANSFSYIGKAVELETNANAVSNGEATWSYLIEGSPTDVKLTISDESGTRIAEVDGNIATGVQSFTLDASTYNLQNGQQIYLSVNAKGQNDTSLNTRTTSTVVVDGVWSNQNESYLTSGDISFRQSDVLKLVENNS